MTTYKITKESGDKPEKYYTNLMTAINRKEYLKKLLNCKEENTYHIFGKYKGRDDWIKLE